MLRTPLRCSWLQEAAGPFSPQSQGAALLLGEQGTCFKSRMLFTDQLKNKQCRQEHETDSSKIKAAQQSRVPHCGFYFHTSFMTSWPAPGFLFHRKFQHQKTQIRPNSEGFFFFRNLKEKGRSCNSRALNLGSRTVRRNTHSIMTSQPFCTQVVSFSLGIHRRRPYWGSVTRILILSIKTHPLNCLEERIIIQPGGLI